MSDAVKKLRIALTEAVGDLMQWTLTEECEDTQDIIEKGFKVQQETFKEENPPQMINENTRLKLLSALERAKGNASVLLKHVSKDCVEADILNGDTLIITDLMKEFNQHP